MSPPGSRPPLNAAPLAEESEPGAPHAERSEDWGFAPPEPEPGSSEEEVPEPGARGSPPQPEPAPNLEPEPEPAPKLALVPAFQTGTTEVQAEPGSNSPPPETSDALASPESLEAAVVTKTVLMAEISRLEMELSGTVGNGLNGRPNNNAPVATAARVDAELAGLQKWVGAVAQPPSPPPPPNLPKVTPRSFRARQLPKAPPRPPPWGAVWHAAPPISPRRAHPGAPRPAGAVTTSVPPSLTRPRAVQCLQRGPPLRSISS
jgi:hypothetical protein